jgi:hypothetical protein
MDAVGTLNHTYIHTYTHTHTYTYRSDSIDVRMDAVGTLNHMSRCHQAREVLIKTNVVKFALEDVFTRAETDTEEGDAVLARACMALANGMCVDMCTYIHRYIHAYTHIHACPY